MLLSIIVVSYNTQELTLRTLKSIFADLQRSTLLKNQADVWLVDNHSVDQTLAEVERMFPTQLRTHQLHMLKNDSNLGFARANNLAIEQSQGQFVLLLNSDTQVQPQALEIMVQTFLKQLVDDSTSALERTSGQVDRLGILAAALVNADGSPQPQGGSLPNLLSLTSHMLLIDDLPVVGRYLPSTQHTGYRTSLWDVDALPHTRLWVSGWVGGTAMMLRREMLLEIGLLDQNIFMYGEDVELCLRAQHHQWDVAIQPRAQVMHLGSASSSSSRAIKGEFAGYIYIWSKHYPAWQLPLVRLILKLGALLRWLIFGTMGVNRQKGQVYRELCWGK